MLKLDGNDFILVFKFNKNQINMNRIPDFNKTENGLIPAIIQDYKTSTVLMLGYMNEQAYLKTKEIGYVTFYSRSKQRLWTKGETSGNKLELIEIKIDCDLDTILIMANPKGPTCHTGDDTCFGQNNRFNEAFISTLESIIINRKNNPTEHSYVASLFKKGINKIAQKVGEEAVELVIESKDDNDDLFLNEAADLFFHYLILLQAKKFHFEDVINVLKGRMK